LQFAIAASGGWQVNLTKLTHQPWFSVPTELNSRRS